MSPSPATTAPSGNGSSDKQQAKQCRTVESDMDWIAKEFQKQAVWKRNPSFCQALLKDILPAWQRDLYNPHASLNNPWTKIQKRIAKEVNESEPCIQFVLDILSRRKQSSANDQHEKVIVVDLCSGFGITSMLMSELLPPDQVEKILLLDIAFPMKDYPTESQHITTNHLHERDWPIALQTRKFNLKRRREIRQLQERVFRHDSKIIFVGIHLCKALAVHAINLYHSCAPGALGLVLKPCCLPGSKHVHVKKGVPIEYIFDANGYSFRPMDLYNSPKRDRNNNDDDDAPTEINNDDDEQEVVVQTQAQEQEHESAALVEEETTDQEHEIEETHAIQHENVATNARFDKWVRHLERGCQGPSYDVELKTIRMSKHFQNQFLYCQTISSNGY